jgi:hypothetical protein
VVATRFAKESQPARFRFVLCVPLTTAPYVPRSFESKRAAVAGVGEAEQKVSEPG